MKLLLDTQILLWLLSEPQRLSQALVVLIRDEENELFFSAVSMWEIAIKQRRGHQDFSADAEEVYRQLTLLQYRELDFTSAHAFGTKALPMIHKDPFDRALLAQAEFEVLTLVTEDQMLTRYNTRVWCVR